MGDGRELSEVPLSQTLAADRRVSSTLISLLVGMQNIGTIRKINVERYKKIFNNIREMKQKL